MALGYTLIKNHPFLDGNKRVGHAAMETFLKINGYQIDAHVDDQELTILNVADGQLSRENFELWLALHCVPSRGDS